MFLHLTLYPRSSINSPLVENLYDISNMLARVQCNKSFDCTFEEPKDYSAEFGALPVATRCWADYKPDIDTSSAFSCTASDTCRVGTTDYGATLNEFGDLVEDENQIVCDSARGFGQQVWV
jgi:hypothetical protein